MPLEPASPRLRRPIVILAWLAYTLVGLCGALLVAFGTNVTPVDNDDILDRFVSGIIGYRVDVGTVAGGFVLIALSFVMYRHDLILERKPNALKSSVDHHMRNGLQAVIGRLEIAAELAADNPEALVQIQSAKTACLELTKRIEGVVEEERAGAPIAGRPVAADWVSHWRERRGKEPSGTP